MVTEQDLFHIRAALNEAHEDIENALKHKDVNKLKPTLSLLKEKEHDVANLIHKLQGGHSGSGGHSNLHRKGAVRRK